MAFIARAELLRFAKPTEYFLDNHNAIPPRHASPFLVYITNTAPSPAPIERSHHPRADDQEASYVLDIFNASQRFEGFHAPRMSFNPLPRPASSRLVQSQFPQRVEFILAGCLLARVPADVKRSGTNGSLIRFNGAIATSSRYSLSIKRIEECRRTSFSVSRVPSNRFNISYCYSRL